MRRIIFIAFWIALSIGWLSEAHPIQEAIPPEENAATYYNKAFGLMKDWPSEDTETRARKIIKEGWKGKDKELEELLKANRSAFEEFRKGVLKEKCQFVEGEITFDTRLRHLAKARNLARLLILQARLYERNGDLEKAITNCLDVIKLGHDLGQDRILVSKLVDIAIFNISQFALKDLVRSENLTPALSRITLSRALELEERSVSLRQTLEGEAACAKSAVKWTLIDIEEAAKKAEETPLEKTKKMWRNFLVLKAPKEKKRLTFLLIKETYRRIDEYYGRTISFIEKGDHKAISAFQDAYFEKMKEKKLTLRDFLRANEKFPELMVDILVVILLPSTGRSSIYFANAQARERFIITTLAVRLFKMEKGRWPQKLDELVPEYLDEVPPDPFGLKPLRYKKREGKWIIYSIGPDGKDDGGVKEYVPREAEEGTDLIFEVE